MNRRLKRLSIGLSIGAVIIAPPAYSLSHWMNSSTSGSVHVGGTAPTTPTTVAATTQPPASLTTDYFSTTLPTGYTVKRQTKAASASSTIQLQVLADSIATQDQQLAITVGNLPRGGFNDVGDYYARSSQPASYHSFTTTGMPAGAKAFQSVTGAPSFTVFSIQSSHYVEVTMSTDGGATLSQLRTAYQQIMSAWQG